MQTHLCLALCQVATIISACWQQSKESKHSMWLSHLCLALGSPLPQLRRALVWLKRLEPSMSLCCLWDTRSTWHKVMSPTSTNSSDAYAVLLLSLAAATQRPVHLCALMVAACKRWSYLTALQDYCCTFTMSPSLYIGTVALPCMIFFMLFYKLA